MTKYLTCAETAKLLRANLKASFPGVKFSVRSNTYAGGASIDVSWTDGPTEAEADKVLQHYAGASFDGMIDLKSYHTSLIAQEDGSVHEVHHGADFVFGSRTSSDEHLARCTGSIPEAPNGRDTHGMQCGGCGNWPKGEDRWVAQVYGTGRDFCCSRECAGKLTARHTSATAAALL